MGGGGCCEYSKRNKINGEGVRLQCSDLNLIYLPIKIRNSKIKGQKTIEKRELDCKAVISTSFL